MNGPEHQVLPEGGQRVKAALQAAGHLGPLRTLLSQDLPGLTGASAGDAAHDRAAAPAQKAPVATPMAQEAP